MPIKNVFNEIKTLTQSIENLSVADYIQEQESNEKVLLIDLRELQERVDLGSIPNSKHVPRGMLEFWADPASPYYRDFFDGEDQRIIVFCAGGGRSVYAALALQKIWDIATWRILRMVFAVGRKATIPSRMLLPTSILRSKW